MFGRGAGDDKSGLIANYFALKCLLDTGFKPEGTVILESVIGEEAGGAGTLAARLEGYNADGMVVTDAFGILVACSGTNSCTVRVKGKIAHAGYAEAGVNAIVKMTTIIQAIAELDEKRGRINYPLFLIGGKKKSCNLVIMSCQSAAKGFSVPGEADIYCSISTVPGEKSEDVRKQFEETVTSAAAKDDWLRENPPEIRWTPRPADPWEQDIKHPFVQLFKACIDETVGVDVPFTGMPSGFDAPIAARFGIPVLGTGGGGSNGHSPNEWVNLAGVFYLAKALALFIAEWCGVKSS